METLHFIVKEYNRIAVLLGQHVMMVGISLVIAAGVGVPLGIFITQRERIAVGVLSAAGVIMTIPSVALFGLMIPILSQVGHATGLLPAVVALVLYAQLPIIRNTYTAIKDVDPAIVEAARGMGMTDQEMLRRVLLPLSLPVIMAGVRTAVVINIGIGTIAYYIGGGGLGEYLFTGLDSTYYAKIITGATFVSLLAIAADIGLRKVERRLSPGGVMEEENIV